MELGGHWTSSTKAGDRSLKWNEGGGRSVAPRGFGPGLVDVLIGVMEFVVLTVLVIPLIPLLLVVLLVLLIRRALK